MVVFGLAVVVDFAVVVGGLVGGGGIVGMTPKVLSTIGSVLRKECQFNKVKTLLNPFLPALW